MALILPGWRFPLRPGAARLRLASMLTTLGFDADDTLWHNENVFVASHRRFCALLAHYHDAETVERALFSTEMRNLPLFGYGIKGFALSSIETAIELTEGRIGGRELREILDLTKEMLAHPVELLDGAAETLAALAGEFQLLLITKGDLRDQERKLARSGLAERFAHVEVVAEKDDVSYARILRRAGVPPAEFLMVGNSMKSDILPVLALGGSAAHVPYEITWQHEVAAAPLDAAGRFFPLASLRELPPLARSLAAGRR